MSEPTKAFTDEQGKIFCEWYTEGLLGRSGWSVGPGPLLDWLVRAALSPSPPQAEVTGWLPIETAPNDESDILICYMNNPRTNRPIITVGSFASDSYLEVEGWTAGKLSDDMAILPTHWQPLPAPPNPEPEK